MDADRSPDARVAALAARRRGLVTGEELRAAGLERGAVDHRLRTGRLHRVHRGVFAVGHPGLDDHARLLAAVLAGGSGALASHGSAAWLWALVAGPPGTPHITVVRTRRPLPGVATHRSGREATRARRRGIPVTTAARTLVDAAGGASPTTLAAMLHEAQVRRLVTPTGLRRELAAAPHEPGTAALRRALDGRTSVTRSRLERRFQAFCRTHGLPPPEPNALVWADEGRVQLEVDGLWRDHAVVVELDGWRFHRSHRAFRDDRAKGLRLSAAGYLVVRVTWEALDHPEALAADLSRTLDHASWLRSA